MVKITEERPEPLCILSVNIFYRQSRSTLVIFRLSAYYLLSSQLSFKREISSFVLRLISNWTVACCSWRTARRIRDLDCFPCPSDLVPAGYPTSIDTRNQGKITQMLTFIQNSCFLIHGLLDSKLRNEALILSRARHLLGGMHSECTETHQHVTG